MKAHIRELISKLRDLDIHAEIINKRGKGHIILKIGRTTLTRTLAVANTPTVPEHTVKNALKEAQKKLEIEP